ncbi:hypothetical protein HYR69_04820 [Candidatus Sumerlaeota bacterium]|nr:hypothetical protein [Candidatus Sumerlaeota bacterium]
MAKPLTIAPAVPRRLRALPKAEKVECPLALCEISEGFGQPQIHTGPAIRKLGSTLFECRGNLALRFIFHNRSDDLFIAFLGNYDKIKALLKSGRYR